MKVTYTIKDMSELFYAQLQYRSEIGKFEHLKGYAFGSFSHCIKQKVGSGQFRDKVELNQLIRDSKVKIAYKLEPRKGYMLATFEFSK